MASPCEFAPAKVNLALHITGRRADGYHLLDSLVVFPRIGDMVELVPGGAALTITGPFGAGLAADADNLVLRAARLSGGLPPDTGLRLIKNLPVASGIGGGSADAAATLRLLEKVSGAGLPPADSVLGLGADVPVCLRGEACRMSGIGEHLDPVPLPPLPILLVNPMVPVRTADVFAALPAPDCPPLPAIGRFRDAAALFAWLRQTRNDLQQPAQALRPEISETLAMLEALPGCAISRMSGSGATCFGLFGRPDQAQAGADALRLARPGWWVAAE